MSNSTREEKLAQLKALQEKLLPKAKNEIVYTQYFDFWKMLEGETNVVRFLRDANPDNPRQFVVENFTHSFNIGGKTRVVACLEMYGEKCPVCELSRQYYNEAKAAGEPKPDPAKGIFAGPLTTLGKKYFRKREYLAQVKIQSSTVDFAGNEGHEHEAPIKLGPQIFNLIQAAFGSGDLENVPFEEKGGYDFRIKKSMQGTSANYTLSSFAPKQSDLDDDVIANLNLYDLSTLRSRKTDLAVVEALLLADRTGQPLVLPTKASNESTPSEATPSAYNSSSSVMEAVETPDVDTTSISAQVPGKVTDVLAQIRERAAANKAAAAAAETA